MEEREIEETKDIEITIITTTSPIEEINETRDIETNISPIKDITKDTIKEDITTIISPIEEDSKTIITKETTGVG
jgi:hypothetical protein